LTHQPEGGFYIFLDFAHHQEKLEKQGITTSKKLAEALLEETGIAILPGSVFGRVP
jgi:aspartate aminotransferase